MRKAMLIASRLVYQAFSSNSAFLFYDLVLLTIYQLSLQNHLLDFRKNQILE